MKVAVTGANGLIGSNLCRELCRQGFEVCAVVRQTSDLSQIQDLPLTFHNADVTTDAEALKTAFAECRWVFHCAMTFTYDMSAASDLASSASAGTDNVLSAAKLAGVDRVVLTSSSVVFGYSDFPAIVSEQALSADENNTYIAAKIRQLAHARALGKELAIDVVFTCPTITVGGFVTKLGPSNGQIMSYLSDPFRFSFPGGCNVVSARCVAEGHVLVADKGEVGRCYILDGENVTWREFHALVGELAGIGEPGYNLNYTQGYLAASWEELRARFAGRDARIDRAQAAMAGRYYWYQGVETAQLGYQRSHAREALAEALSWLVQSDLCDRNTRSRLLLHRDVYAVRYGRFMDDDTVEVR